MGHMSVTTGITSETRQRDAGQHAAQRALWLALIVVGGVGFSPFFACATPFAALATLAAGKLNWRDGLGAVGLVWLANQVIGYGLLGYPWTLNSLGWGVAIGVSSALALVAARALSSARPVRLAISLPFVAAFAVYELALYVAGFALGNETGAFAFAVVRQILEVNLFALVGLLVAAQLASVIGFGSRRLAGGGMVAAAP